jgi:hypothetical protein
LAISSRLETPFGALRPPRIALNRVPELLAESTRPESRFGALRRRHIASKRVSRRGAVGEGRQNGFRRDVKPPTSAKIRFRARKIGEERQNAFQSLSRSRSRLRGPPNGILRIDHAFFAPWTARTAAETDRVTAKSCTPRERRPPGRIVVGADAEGAVAVVGGPADGWPGGILGKPT